PVSSSSAVSSSWSGITVRVRRRCVRRGQWDDRRGHKLDALRPLFHRSVWRKHGPYRPASEPAEVCRKLVLAVRVPLRCQHHLGRMPPTPPVPWWGPSLGSWSLPGRVRQPLPTVHYRPVPRGYALGRCVDFPRECSVHQESCRSFLLPAPPAVSLGRCWPAALQYVPVSRRFVH